MATATESRTFEFSWKGNDVKGKLSGKGSGKKGKSKDAGALVWNQQPSPVASSVASSTPQTETSTTVGTIDAIECTALDLCATALTQQGIVNPCWMAFNVDTGAGGTVWPMNADCACEKISGPAGRNYRTATGEMVEGQGRFRVRCQSVWGHQLHMTVEKDDISQTTVECWRRDRQRTRALVGRKRWLHHPKGLTNSDSNAHVFSKSLRATFVEWSH